MYNPVIIGLCIILSLSGLTRQSLYSYNLFMFEYLFFDLDGTLTDPAEGITNSFIHALKYFGIDEMLEEFDEIGKYGAYIMLGISNLVFLVYDIDLVFMYNLYRKRLMPKFRKKR